jgi:HIRAN domain/PD-(D/E)XK nuclease superfamily
MSTNEVSYHSKLVGVTFEGRQAVISTLKGDEQLRVRREPDNEYDKRAVAVDVLINNQWLPVGYIAKDKNEEIAKAVDAGNNVVITMGGITGGGSKSFGMNISLRYAKVVDVVEPKQEEAPLKPVTKEDAINVLEHLIKALNKGEKPQQPIVKYSSKLLGQTIEIDVVNGHRRLEGYLSGSKFPDQFYAEFDREGILQGIADKFGVSTEAVEAMWKLNNEASTGYGTAIHAALENYHRNRDLGDKIKSIKAYKTKADVVGPNKALSKNPFIKKIVEDFIEKFDSDHIRFVEEFIWDKGLKLCGSVDLIKVIDLKKRIIRIQDYKTDGDIHEKKYQLTTSPFYSLTQGDNPTMGKELLDLHWLQLSFYAFILERAGWKVEGLDIYWLNPTKLAAGENAWEEFSHDVIDITKSIIGE